MDLGRATNPTAADFAGQGPMALGPDSMSWISWKLSLVSLFQEVWRSPITALWAGHSGLICKMKQQEKTGEKKRVVHWAEATWPLRKIDSIPNSGALCFGPHRPSCALCPGKRALSRAERYLVTEHGSWAHLRVSPDSCWPPARHGPHSLSLPLLSRVGIITLPARTWMEWEQVLVTMSSGTWIGLSDVLVLDHWESPN